MPETAPLVSVIIPTYNRKESLLRTLASLARQTYPAGRMEVVVVDDGSTDGTGEMVWPAYGFALCYLRQENQGEIPARQVGVARSRGGLLVFLDDDVEVVAGYIEAHVKAHASHAHAVVVGKLVDPGQDAAGKGDGLVPVSEIESASGVLSISREGYEQAGGMRSLGSPGRNTWGGIDFAHRAVKQGYTVWRAEDAVAVHHDASSRDLASRCQRAEAVGRAVQYLFKEHPELMGRIPMFADKGPIDWGRDRPGMVMRKLLRSLLSSRPIQSMARWATAWLEQGAPGSRLLPHLYNWQISAHIRKGYRQGLKEMQTHV